MDPLLEWRSEFPILEKTVYMISNSLGAMPRQVYDRMREYAETWASRGVRAWAETWWEMPVEVGNHIAPIIGAGRGEVSMHQNVTLAEAVVASCFEFNPPRNRVVYSDLNFPSVMYLYEAQTRRGAEVVMVPSEDGIEVPTEKLLAAIDERTLLVPISHVLYKSACIQDVETIIKHAHLMGAHVVLDIYQSAGTIPVDVKELNVDFAVGGVLKWLCGGPGGAFLYVRPDLARKLEPKLTGWMAYPPPFDFEVGPVGYRGDAFRFLNGTPGIPALYAVEPGCRIVSEIGVERIRQKSLRQTSQVMELAGERGFETRTPRDPLRRGGTVSINAPHAYEVSRELLRRDFLVDYRPRAGIRLSPHFYTKDEELELIVREMVDILESGAYRKHAVARAAKAKVT
ncbi:MAG: aminotransferase class V-fold PLP-dependent enzyme [Acidobacteriota bacterium]